MYKSFLYPSPTPNFLPKSNQIYSFVYMPLLTFLNTKEQIFHKNMFRPVAIFHVRLHLSGPSMLVYKGPLHPL